jgi:hypothetical protein
MILGQQFIAVLSLTCGRCHVVRNRVAPPCSQLSSARWHLAHSVIQPVRMFANSGIVLVVSSDSHLLSFALLPKSLPINTGGNVRLSVELPNLCTSASSSRYCAVCCMVAAQGGPTLALIKTHMKTGLRNDRTFWS